MANASKNKKKAMTVLSKVRRCLSEFRRTLANPLMWKLQQSDAKPLKDFVEKFEEAEMHLVAIVEGGAEWAPFLDALPFDYAKHTEKYLLGLLALKAKEGAQ